MHSWIKNPLIAIAALIALLVTTFLWINRGFPNDPFNDLDFDRDAWIQLQGSADPDNPRGQMVESLRDYLHERRPSREQVIQLLGSSELHCSSLVPAIGSTETCLSYVIGSWSGFRIDNDTLDVYFGADDRVLKALPVQH